MVLCQSRAIRIKSHVGWAAALSSRSRNRIYWVRILLLNQGTTYYYECHPLPIRLASLSSFIQGSGVDAGVLSPTQSPGGKGGATETGRVPFNLPLPPQPASTVTRHYGFTRLTFTTPLVKGMSLTLLVNKENQESKDYIT